MKKRVQQRNARLLKGATLCVGLVMLVSMCAGCWKPRAHMDPAPLVRPAVILPRS